LASSRIYADIGYVPPDFSLIGMEATALNGRVARIGWYYDGPLEGLITVMRTDLDVYPSAPVEVRLPACDAYLYIETAQFHGHLMLLEPAKVGGPQRLTLRAGRTVTTIYADLGEMSELIRMLESFDPPIEPGGSTE
jgi:hypothetical protein